MVTGTPRRITLADGSLVWGVLTDGIAVPLGTVTDVNVTSRAGKNWTNTYRAHAMDENGTFMVPLEGGQAEPAAPAAPAPPAAPTATPTAATGGPVEAWLQVEQGGRVLSRVQLVVTGQSTPAVETRQTPPPTPPAAPVDPMEVPF